MNGTSIARLSRDTGIPVDELLRHLTELNIVVPDKESLVSGTDQLRLLQRLRAIDAEVPTKHEVTLTAIEQAPTLATLNNLLTKAMATRQIQALVKGRGLDSIVDRILELKRRDDHRDELLSTAALQRLSAVVRGDRRSIVQARIADAITGELPPIDSLPDADTKTYAAEALAQIDQPWLDDYLAREAVAIDTADNARRELLKLGLRRAGDIATWIGALTNQIDSMQTLSSTAKQKRIRRLFACARIVVQESRQPVGSDIGSNLADCLKRFFASIDQSVFDEHTVFESIDHLLSVLRRAIELRFSVAMQPDAYRLLGQVRQTLGVGLWSRFNRESAVLPELRTILLEAVLVLARQSRTDTEFVDVLVRAYRDRRQAASAVKKQFKEARDLDPQTEDWWSNLGKLSHPQQTPVHKVGTTEDFEIANALIEIDRIREAMSKIGRAVVPLLDISDPVLASTARIAVSGYREVDQTMRRLARMRRLVSTDWGGEVVEYNPLRHELIGGHVSGIRRVKIVREGVEKDFKGRRRILVKPWVEQAE